MTSLLRQRKRTVAFGTGNKFRRQISVLKSLLIRRSKVRLNLIYIYIYILNIVGLDFQLSDSEKKMLCWSCVVVLFKEFDTGSKHTLLLILGCFHPYKHRKDPNNQPRF